MRRLGFLPAILLAACAAKQPPAPPTGDTSEPTLGSCDATKAQFAIGQKATPELIEKVKRAAGASVVRRIRPGQMVTMDYSGQRLNLKLDDADVVKEIRCG